MPEIKVLNGSIIVDTNNLKQVCLDVFQDEESLVEQQSMESIWLFGSRARMTREGALKLIEALAIVYLDRGCPRFDKEKTKDVRDALENWRERLAFSREEFREWLDRLTQGEGDEEREEKNSEDDLESSIKNVMIGKTGRSRRWMKRIWASIRS